MSKLEEKGHDNNTFEDILKMAGTTGWKNVMLMVAIYYVSFVNAIDVFSSKFLGKTPKFHCQNDFLQRTNWTFDEKLDISTPLKSDGTFNYCEIYDLPYDILYALPYDEAKLHISTNHPNNVSIIPCEKREFEEDIITTTTQWDLVCERRVLYSTTQSGVQVGRLFGSMLFGYLSDKYGRRAIFKVCVIGIIVFQILLALSSGIWTFIIIKLLAAFFGIGASLSTFVLQLEIILTNQRNYIGSLGSIFWGFGLFYLCGAAYYVRTWYILQVLLVIPGLFLILIVWFLPESPRWLIVNNEFEKSYVILDGIAKANKRMLPEKAQIMKTMNKIYNDHQIASGDSKEVTEDQVGNNYCNKMKNYLKSILILIIDRRFTKTTIAILYCWFAVSFVYYGVSLGSPSPGTAINDYAYLAIGAVTEIIMAFVPWIILNYIGRKKTLSGFYLVCAASIIFAMILIILEKNIEYIGLQWTLFAIGRLGIIGAFMVIYLFTAELYPTNYRTLAIGQSSTAARVGSIFSSYINDLLGESIFWAPSALFGTVSALSAVAIATLPETKGKELPDFAAHIPDKKGRDNFGLESIESCKANR